MLAFHNRFHGRGGIRYVYSHGNVVRTRQLTVKYLVAPRRRNARIAVVISKKVLKSAVGRNRVRRRLYEYMRRRINDLPKGMDFVIIVGSAELASISNEQLNDTLDPIIEGILLNKPSEN